MARRVTIIIDNDLDKKLRTIQAKKIMQNAKNSSNAQSYSFSKAINDTLRERLK